MCVNLCGTVSWICLCDNIFFSELIFFCLACLVSDAECLFHCVVNYVLQTKCLLFLSLFPQQRFPTEDHLMIHRHKHEMTLKFPSIKTDNMLSGKKASGKEDLRGQD